MFLIEEFSCFSSNLRQNGMYSSLMVYLDYLRKNKVIMNTEKTKLRPVHFAVGKK